MTNTNRTNDFRTNIARNFGRSRPRLLLAFALSAGLAMATGLGGCAGAFTGEGASKAKEKMDVMKSATEWQTAHQAFLSGDLKKALKSVDRSIALSPNVPKSHVLRGRISMEQSNMEQAFKSFARASELDASNAEAPYYMGIAYERIAQPQKAMEFYSKAADIDPESAQYAIATAEAMTDIGQVDEAETYLTTRQAAFEHNAGIRQTLGHIATMRGNHTKAALLLNDARLLAPDDLGITEDLVRAQVATSKFNDAEFNLTKMLQNPTLADRRDLQHLRVRCLVEVDRLLEARELAIKLTNGDIGQSDVESWVQLGNISYLLKDSNRTKQASARVVALAPDRADGYVMQGLHYRREGNLEHARISFQRAAQIQPASETLVMLGLVQRDLNQPGAARQSFAEAVKQNPSDATATQLLAEVETGQ